MCIYIALYTKIPHEPNISYSLNIFYIYVHSENSYNAAEDNLNSV